MKSFFALVASVIVVVQAGHLHQEHHHEPIVYTTGGHGHHGGIGAYPYHFGGYNAFDSVPIYGGHHEGHFGGIHGGHGGHFGGIHGGHHGGYVVPAAYSLHGGYSAGWAKK